MAQNKMTMSDKTIKSNYSAPTEFYMVDNAKEMYEMRDDYSQRIQVVIFMLVIVLATISKPRESLVVIGLAFGKVRDSESTPIRMRL